MVVPTIRVFITIICRDDYQSSVIFYFFIEKWFFIIYNSIINARRT